MVKNVKIYKFIKFKGRDNGVNWFKSKECKNLYIFMEGIKFKGRENGGN